MIKSYLVESMVKLVELLESSFHEKLSDFGMFECPLFTAGTIVYLKTTHRLFVTCVYFTLPFFLFRSSEIFYRFSAYMSAHPHF